MALVIFVAFILIVAVYGMIRDFERASKQINDAYEKEQNQVYQLAVFSGSAKIYENLVKNVTDHGSSFSVTEINTGKRILVSGDFTMIPVDSQSTE